jgi:hypothetical protein
MQNVDQDQQQGMTRLTMPTMIRSTMEASLALQDGLLEEEFHEMLEAK